MQTLYKHSCDQLYFMFNVYMLFLFGHRNYPIFWVPILHIRGIQACFGLDDSFMEPQHLSAAQSTPLCVLAFWAVKAHVKAKQHTVGLRKAQ